LAKLLSRIVLAKFLKKLSKSKQLMLEKQKQLSTIKAISG